MRKHNASPPSVVQRCNHVLDKSVIPISLRRNSKTKASIRIMLGFFIAPIFQGEGGISNNNIKLHKLSLISLKLGRPQGIPFFQLGILQPVEQQIHFADGPCADISFLTKKSDVSRILSFISEVINRLNKHSSRTTGGVTNTHFLLGVQNLHQ